MYKCPKCGNDFDPVTTGRDYCSNCLKLKRCGECSTPITEFENKCFVGMCKQCNDGWIREDEKNDDYIEMYPGMGY